MNSRRHFHFGFFVSAFSFRLFVSGSSFRRCGRRYLEDDGAGLFVPDASMQRAGLVLEHRPDHFGGTLAAFQNLAAGQIEGGILRMVAGHGPQAVFTQAVHQPANSAQ